MPLTLRRVHGPDADTVILEFATREPLFLLLNVAPGMARLHLVAQRPANPPVPYGFVERLRACLEPSRLTAVLAPENERVARLTFEAPSEEPGAVPTRYELVAEMFGRFGNLLLLDASQRILGLMHPNRSHKRELVPQALYVPPPAAGIPAPEEALPAVTPEPALAAFPAHARAAAFYAAQTHADEATELARLVENALKKERHRLQRNVVALDKALQEADRAPEWIRAGDVLRSHYHELKRGAREVELLDYATGETLRIALDPALPLSDNVAAYYRRAKKAERGRAVVTERRAKLLDALDHVERVAELAESREIPDLRRALDALGEAPEAPHQQTARQAAFDKAPPFRRFVSASGREIRVGRSAEENDRLTFRFSKGDDLWLHVTGSSGAHVVVPCRRDQEIDDETLLDAATLALHYAKSKGASEVAYTRVRALRKAKRAPAGQVYYHQAKNLTLRVDPARLRRLMDGPEGI